MHGELQGETHKRARDTRASPYPGLSSSHSFRPCCSMEEEWISRLNTRVDRAERLYVLGDVEEALRVADSTLNEWISLASGAGAFKFVRRSNLFCGSLSPLTFRSFSLRARLDVPPTRKLDEDLHVCQKNCICRACILLIVQALYDKGDAQAADAYLLRYYSSFIKMPHSSFLLWYTVRFHFAVAFFRNDYLRPASPKRCLRWWWFLVGCN